MKNTQMQHGTARHFSENEARMMEKIRSITAQGKNVEIRRLGEGFSVMEVTKHHVAL